MTKQVLILNKKNGNKHLLINYLLQIVWHLKQSDTKSLALITQWHKGVLVKTITELDTFFLKKEFREWSSSQKTQEASKCPVVVSVVHMSALQKLVLQGALLD